MHRADACLQTAYESLFSWTGTLIFNTVIVQQIFFFFIIVFLTFLYALVQAAVKEVQ